MYMLQATRRLSHRDCAGLRVATVVLEQARHGLEQGGLPRRIYAQTERLNPSESYVSRFERGSTALAGEEQRTFLWRERMESLSSPAAVGICGGLLGRVKLPPKRVIFLRRKRFVSGTQVQRRRQRF